MSELSFDNLEEFSKDISDDERRIDLAVEGISCVACIIQIEKEMQSFKGVTKARVNFSSNRLSLQWQKGVIGAKELVEKLISLGYKAQPFDPILAEKNEGERAKWLLRCLSIAGFASGNIMLLSVSIWSGNVSGIDENFRALFQWISALIAIPAVAYAGQPFFQSALISIKSRNINMDVPISLAVILAILMSIAQLYLREPDTYFDSAVMLLFFLLIGRYLDEMMRRRMNVQAKNLLVLQGQSARRRNDDGSLVDVPLSKLKAGDVIYVYPGERISVDGVISNGQSYIDVSLITGESVPIEAAKGDKVFAGTLNQTGSLNIKVVNAVSNTVLEKISELLERVSESKDKFVKLADKAASIYVPVVHSVAIIAFLGWLYIGAGWQISLLVAISVLIITCPCALGLAIPAVQVVSSSMLFKNSILMNSGDALERMHDIDVILFDKTGTLTKAGPEFINAKQFEGDEYERALRLAKSSRHVLARALTVNHQLLSPFDEVEEVSGAGVKHKRDGVEMRLGSASFCNVNKTEYKELVSEYKSSGSRSFEAEGFSELFYRENDKKPKMFLFKQQLRDDAIKTISALKADSYEIEIISGDKSKAVSVIANELGIGKWQGEMSPEDKILRIEELQNKGMKVLMVGDGLNDAPSLKAANASISPSSAADISRNIADYIFMKPELFTISKIIKIAKMARLLMLQNLGFAAFYNLVAIPLAMLGYASPLVAAIAMSSSSVVVMLNSLRGVRQKL